MTIEGQTRLMKVLEIIREAERTRATRLNLPRSGLKEIPEELSRLQNLTSLSLSNNQLTEIPEHLARLQNLTSLNLIGNQLTEIPEHLARLQNLNTLDLSGNRLTEIPEHLARLQNLNTLDLSGNRLTEIPEHFARLQNLTWLNLSDNQLREIQHLARLQNLTKLFLRGNQLTEIPEHFARLQNLTSLDLSGNRLTEIPEHLARLQNLTSLHLRGNQLTEIPEHLTRLQNLTSLHLSQNQLTKIPEHLTHLQNLTDLSLSRNQLTEIPEYLFYFPGFTSLETKGVFSAAKSALDVTGNPISSPPRELLEQGLEAVREYYRQVKEEGTEKLYEAKLLIVGEPKAGKTTLTHKIQNPAYELENIPSTEGIDIVRWQFDHPSGSPFRVNIWDFGGQEIYQATHQFFLTKRSCYALVTNTRREDANLYYWLSIIQLLADDSPVLIIKNEEGDRPRDLNDTKLRGEFAQLKDSRATNLATNRGLDALLDQIRHQLSHLPHIGDELPKTWVRVRNALETNPGNTIPLETYLKLCEDNGFKHRKDALQLSQYLHDLGVFLHFQDDDLLAKTIILKPTWGTDAVYKVLDNKTVIQNQGCFNRRDLDEIWSAEEYTGLQGELLQLMVNFQLCYELPNQPKHYIAPQLLPENQPRYTWDETENLILRYTYTFMPKGILTRFIVALHKDIEKDPRSNQQIVWRTGVLLTKDNTLAEVTEYYEKRELKIRLYGSNKRGLLEIITHEIDKIHDSFHGLQYEQLIPCNCDTCHNSQDPYSYTLKELKHFAHNNQAEIQCRKSFRNVNVYGLIDDIGDRSKLLGDRIYDRSIFTTTAPMTNEPTPPPESTLSKFLENIKDPMTWVKATAAVLVTTGATQLPGLLTSEEPAKELEQEIYVYDSDTNTPLPGVDVRFLAPGGAIGDRTNSDGFTELTVPQSKDIDIELRKDGYQPQTKKLNLVIDAERRKTYYLAPNEP